MAQETCSLRSINGRLILLAAILASGAAFLAGSAVAVALPRIQAEFGTALSGIQWVVNANLLALSALMLIGGALGDQYGRKRVFITGLSVFSLAALSSGFAPSLPVLVPLQALQGVGSALMVPQSLAIINDCFEESERGRAIGLWAGISGAIAAVGPLAGGWLVDTLSWYWVFFMMVPIGLLALIVSILFVPRIRPSGSHKLDWPGGVIILLGLFGLAFGLIRGPESGWDSPLVLSGLGIGFIAIIFFIIYENHRPQPLAQLKIFRSPLVAGANAVTFFLYFGLNGILFFTVLNLQQVQGFSPTQAGLGLLPPIALITVLTGPSGALADRIGPRLQMILGPMIVAAGMTWLAMAGVGASYVRDFLPGLVLFGLGMSVVIPPLTKSALTVEPAFSGSASGINNGISRMAGLMAIAVLGVLVLTTFSARLNDNLATSGLTSAQQAEISQQSEKLGGIVIPDTFDAVDRQRATAAVNDSFAYGFRWVMAACAGLAFSGAVISAITIRGTKLPEGINEISRQSGPPPS